MIINSTIGHYGRFGNMLFQIAAVIGIARKNGQSYGFLPFVNHDHKERFGSTEDVDLQKYFENPLPNVLPPYPEQKVYSWGYHDIALPPGNYDISGHFQSERYFKHCIDEVRHYMLMKEERTLANHYDKVVIHVRRGDYDDHYHPRVGQDYYNRAISMFPEGTEFIVFSDDIESAFEMLGIDDSVSYREDTDYIQDFALMKQCGHFICANSSYSLMAAILSENPYKKIICPGNWFGPAWGSPGPETKDLYPEGAIVL